jgi:hypothetical protein
MDVAFFNAVANDPHVRPFLGDGSEEPIDISPLVLNPANICIATEHGGWVLQCVLPTMYELHTLFRRSGRGRIFKELAAEALHYAFTATDLLELRTRCPDSNPAARMAAIWVGFREMYRVGPDPPGGTSHQTLTVDDWMLRDPRCWEEGEGLRGAMEVLGATLPDEDALTYAMGAAIGMAKAGNVPKAIGVFNRWSIFAGYGSISSPSPGIVDIGAALLDVGGGQVRVLR